MNIRILAEAAQAAFVWQEHMGKIIGTALLSMVPTYEGRYALVTGAAMGLPDSRSIRCRSSRCKNSPHGWKSAARASAKRCIRTIRRA